MLVDWLSNAYIGHPLVQAFVYDAGIAFGLCALLGFVWCCMFLGFFARNRRYTFPPHSLSEKCWKATWLLQIAVILVLVRHFCDWKRDMPTGAILFTFSPYVVMILSFILAGRYYQTTGKALQEADRKQYYGKRASDADRAANDSGI